MRKLYFTKAGVALCGRCYAERPPAGTSNVYTGKKVWTGQEVYGSKLGSDELRADTEADLIEKHLPAQSYPPWFVERMATRGRGDRL